MPRKVRDLIRDLNQAGFSEIAKGGKGSHRKFTHRHYPGAVTVSGKRGDDVKHYQEKQVKKVQSRSSMRPSDQYHKWVEWSDEDQVYIGKCPDVITCIHGEDAAQLYSELCQVVDEVLEHFAAEGRPLPVPRVRPMQEVG